MRKIWACGIALAALCASPVLAADLPARRGLPVKAPAYSVPVYTWSGCFIGGHVGGGFGQKDWVYTDDNGAPVVPAEDVGGHDVSGAVVGGQVGCDFQSGTFVFGIQGMGAWSGIRGSHFNPLSTDDELVSKVRWLASLTGRAGIAFQQSLLYVRGGVAFAGDQFTEYFQGDTYRASHTRTGWTFGVGGEMMFAANWSGFIEWNYYDFGNKFINLVNPDGPVTAGFEIDQHIHVVKIGVNYRFGGGGIVARN